MIYVITLNWNRCADTLEFLASCSQLAKPNARFLVVDNGSTDGSPQEIAKRYPQVEHIINDRNLGFAGGVNVGIRHALAQGADWICLANNDTQLAPDALSLLVEAASAADAALASPAIYYASDPQRIWAAGGLRNQLTLEITGSRRGQPGEVLGETPFEVDFVTACGMLIRRDCLETVGLFDERFFMYYEDSDYCLRARRAGHRAIIVPRARMWHKVAASSGGDDSPGERYYMALSSVQFFRKNVQGWSWLIVAPYRTASALRTSIRLVMSGQSRAVQSYWRGIRDGLLR